jgi:hypothetical protein
MVATKEVSAGSSLVRSQQTEDLLLNAPTRTTLGRFVLSVYVIQVL